MKNSVRGDSSTGSELKAVEEACREAPRTVEPCASAVNSAFPLLVAAYPWAISQSSAWIILPLYECNRSAHLAQRTLDLLRCRYWCYSTCR